jgi:hypothetical protein
MDVSLPCGGLRALKGFHWCDESFRSAIYLFGVLRLVVFITAGDGAAGSNLQLLFKFLQNLASDRLPFG